MTSAQATDIGIETYLQRLNAALEGVAPSEKDEILREIRCHILDSSASAPDSEAAVERVLRLLGTPEELAARYTTESMLTRASRSFSPWLLLRTCWRWAMHGLKGTMAFFLALFGYGLALGATIVIFLKPLMPSRVGMWSGSGSFVIGFSDQAGVKHELLGRWFIPVMAVAAFGMAIGTTHALRWMIRRRTPRTFRMPQTTTPEIRSV
jgi:hypothetical protein